MSAHSILFDFSVDPTNLIGNTSSILVLYSNIENVLKNFFNHLKTINSYQLDGSFVKLFTATNNSLFTLRIFDNGLITLTIEYLVKDENEKPLLSLEQCNLLKKNIKEAVKSVDKIQVYPPIKRGLFMRYFISSDERLLEYDIDKNLFEKVTPYQKVQILHSKSLGNMLVLDDLQNIAESDLIYTETLMQRGIENYEGKDIVILGGGDGALLYELLKEKPREVIMLEIDEVVMQACAKYMRSICGDVLDCHCGPSYKIIVGDCMKTLEEYVKTGRKFDYIFGDLTDVPISEELSGQLWTFINKTLELSFKILRPTGKFMTHLTGTCSMHLVDKYIEQLKAIKPPVKYTTAKAFVPSFLEEWNFCQISFAEQ